MNLKIIAPVILIAAAVIVLAVSFQSESIPEITISNQIEPVSIDFESPEIIQ